MAASDLLDSLQCDGCEVARLMERITGGWFAVLRYPSGKQAHRDCTSFESGKAGCERWAMRHLGALQAVSRRRRLEQIARQPWRGDDSFRARATIALQDAQKLQDERGTWSAAIRELAL